MSKSDRRKCSADLIGFFCVSLLGCLNHFVYELSGRSPAAAVFAPVNESTWEHLKLLFFPYILFLTAEFILCGRKTDGFLFSGVTGVLCGMLFIPAAFYLYTSITGKSCFVIDILIFFAAVLISFRVRSERTARGIDRGIMKSLSAVILIAGITALFIGFTFFPPDSPLFRSPV